MRRLILIIIMLLCPLTGHARQITPVEGLEALRKAFAGTNDFSAEMTQEKRLSMMKRTITMTGSVRFRKPDLFYLQIAAPYASRIVLRDTVIEQVMGNDGDRNRIVLPPEQGLKRWFDKIATPVTTVPEGIAVQADRTGQTYTVTILPQGKGQVRELVISFQEDGTVKRLVIVEQNGDRAVMTFRNMRRNTGLTEKDFKLD
ncbi:outer membrane lipoprotein carrier protein LolA [Geobacter sp. SVR]|uniref:LolA family protein n=1 Tax=Geobacter sp. SVR TaxID=2495594 RepID=UPI00143EFD8E|nr:outer membrane lipoprotein carrier protein LolA [Geobacter sp. SVR]BCS54293.1 outer-membrane lipoprotein carrier protein [Geobacter sp. SVR]GCF85848.1 outer-membrane lipoprotein carrier protein [Geobacter sp. SVR]